ncbi:endolytic transglycosylase MltG [Ruminococcus albus]|uniref:Endolytic murein transglycosylase n=1 Tax=Ruminococcus albus (strain ATCC 27210 / DSM 20455 / JCM 14654 / NCDO 2250 / 7) TaxID=697329 RepID=E6UAM5_RUMA7|nr:endolytic transglycosylase MltG [Ruminococcus albus]ADU22447.1 aminodeoxychorismate lyase [Ruminococcus albus 7 = DSM 20455]
MSDKKFDIDDILGDNKNNTDDISVNDKKTKKNTDIDEIDELLASLKNNNRRRRTSSVIIEEEKTESSNNEVPASSDAKEETEKVSDGSAEDNNDVTDDPVISSVNEDLKKHFGKDPDDGFDEEDDEDDEDEIPVRKSSNNRSHPSKERRADTNKKKGNSRSGNKKKKKSRVRFNGSIFGGIILVTIILTLSLLLAVSGLTLGMEFYGIGKSDDVITFNIPKGSDNDDIADLLVENGIIKNKKLFIYTVKLMKANTIYPGDIQLKPSDSYSDIIDKLAEQRESFKTVTVTFTEGEYLIDIAKKLEENKVCPAGDFLFEFNKDMGYKFEGYLTDSKNTLFPREGYLFPDTYEFYVDDTPYNITKILRDHYDSKINDALYKKMNDRGLSLNQTITLASIVQQEAANVQEMPKVASVFLNRLKDSDTFPMLQSDTTYNYIEKVIKTQESNEATIDHYIEYYDTYAIDGLPAGPICNPGMDAIKAVLDPAETNYYYFCNDLETGETFYAETLDEHEKNLVKAGRSDQVVDDNVEDNNE